MLRRIFFSNTGELEMPNNTSWDIKPREVFVAIALLVPIIGIGLYPKLATQTYDVKSTELANRVQNIRLAQNADHGPFYAQVLTAPELLASRLSTVSIR